MEELAEVEVHTVGRAALSLYAPLEMFRRK